MDRHKSLYKENSFALSPRQHKQLDREHRNADRAKNRNDMFQSTRNIVDSPLSNHSEDLANSPTSSTIIPLPMSSKNNINQDANKENSKMTDQNNFNNAKNVSYASRIAMVATNCGNTKKLSRQEAFLKRFLDWKDVKKEEGMLKRQTKKPAFVPSGVNTVKNAKTTAAKNRMVTASFVPKNHPRHFKPPEGLKNPAASSSDAPVSSVAIGKQRKSIYTVVQTPTKKNPTVEPSTKRKAGPHSHFERFNSIPPTDRRVTTCTIPKTNGFLSNKKSIATTIAKEKPIPAATIRKEKPITAPRTTTTTTLPKSTCTKGTTETTTNTNALAKTVLKPRPLILPPPPPPPPPKIIITRKPADADALIAKPISGNGQSTSTAGACGKVKLLQIKRNDIASKRPTQPQKNAKLTVSLKAKKPTGRTAAGAAAVSTARTFGLKGKTLLKPTKESLPIVETPTDLANVNPYAVFVTSTQFKSYNTDSALTTKARDDANKKFGDLSDLISPVEALVNEKLMLPPLPPKHTSSISAKRALLQNGGKRKDKLASPEVNGNQRKFNFVYYSEVDSPIPSSKRSVQLTEQQELPKVKATNNCAGVAPLTLSASKRASSATTSLLKQCIGEKVKVKLTSKEKANQHKFNFVRHTEIVDSPIPPSAASKSHKLEKQEKDENNLKEIVQEETIAVKDSEALEKLNKIESNVSTIEDCDATIVNKKQNTFAYQLLLTEGTPPKEQTVCERPANYLSPFVSVSRGKVSAKVEREKRNSIYLQTPPDQTDGSTEKDSEVKQQKTTPAEMVAEDVELRRTMETVRYFRKQVSDQIARLHELCDRWEAYKQDALERLQETAGDDMINATIGQTKLLTSRKFKQFIGLVDRCEAITMGIATGSPPIDDGSEATKLITVVDLEGFWSMVGLQIDNVEKRFENLESWKANNWADPDEVKVKAKKNLTKVKKAKTNIVNAVSKTAKPSSSLQQMLRKMQAEMRKNKATAAAANTSNSLHDIINVLTPPSRKRRSHSGTPTLVQRRLASRTSATGRISVIVQDRKSRSAAATVISIPSPASSSSVSCRRSSLAQSRKLPSGASPFLDSSIKEFRRSLTGLYKVYERNDFLKTALVGATNEQQRRKSINYGMNTPPLAVSPPTSALSRKSILKTPGTAKGKIKNVIFNDKLHIRKFKFTLEGDQSDDDEETQKTKNCLNDNLEHEESDQRTYSLRNRKVVLRPSSEFEIPRA